MDPSLAAPIATLTGAVATAILMWASYNFPHGYHRGGAEKNDEDEDEDEDEPPKARKPRQVPEEPRRRLDNGPADGEADLD